MTIVIMVAATMFERRKWLGLDDVEQGSEYLWRKPSPWRRNRLVRRPTPILLPPALLLPPLPPQQSPLLEEKSTPTQQIPLIFMWTPLASFVQLLKSTILSTFSSVVICRISSVFRSYSLNSFYDYMLASFSCWAGVEIKVVISQNFSVGLRSCFLDLPVVRNCPRLLQIRRAPDRINARMLHSTVGKFILPILGRVSSIRQTFVEISNSTK